MEPIIYGANISQEYRGKRAIETAPELNVDNSASEETQSEIEEDPKPMTQKIRRARKRLTE